jgi:hypothetical protein
MLRRPILVAHAAAAFVLVGCDGSTAPASVAGGGGSLSASIDGAAFTADGSTAEARHSQPGKYVLSGTKTTGASQLGLEIDLYNISTPGTYPLGVGDKVFGGVGWVTTASPPTYWLTPNSGAAGSVTITSLTDTRIAGSFSYNAPAYTVIGDATGTRTVTSGSFDLPVKITGTVGDVPANAGGKMSAVIGGVPWNAANVTYNKTSGNVQFTGDNSSYLVGINLAGVTGTGTFNLTNSPLRILTVSGPSTNPTGLNCCWGGTVGVVAGAVTLNDAGSVTITTFSSSRIAGTFGAVLGGVPNTLATGQLVVANGSFDVGIP